MRSLILLVAWVFGVSVGWWGLLLGSVLGRGSRLSSEVGMQGRVGVGWPHLRAIEWDYVLVPFPFEAVGRAPGCLAGRDWEPHSVVDGAIGRDLGLAGVIVRGPGAALSAH